jgi:hypothetical protein
VTVTDKVLPCAGLELETVTLRIVALLARTNPGSKKNQEAIINFAKKGTRRDDQLALPDNFNFSGYVY